MPKPMDPGLRWWRDRGVIITKQTLRSAQWQTHPNDIRIRVVPDGPYTQAWEGVQKVNPLAYVGTHYQPVLNPLQTGRMTLPTINQNNPIPSFFGTGPITQRQLVNSQQTPGTPSIGFWQGLLAKLRGNG